MLTMCHLVTRKFELKMKATPSHSGISGPGEGTGRDKERRKTEGGVGDGE